MNFSDNHAPEPDDPKPTGLPCFPGAPSEPVAVEVGVADYFNRHPEEAASILVAKAPDVLVLARCIGAPKTANYFAERLKCKVTEKMIKTIKSKVAKDVILVTRKELEAAALSHPITAARMAREPSLCDPQHYKTFIKSKPEDHEMETSAKKATVKKTATKKAAAKKSAEKSKKTAEAKTPGTPGVGAATQTPETPTPPAATTSVGTTADDENPSAPDPTGTVGQDSPTGLKQIMSDDALAKKQALLAQLKKEVRGSE